MICALMLLAAMSLFAPASSDARDVLQITDGRVEARFDPVRRRLMHFGRVDGPNLLWTRVDHDLTAAKPDWWINFGGEKVWMWPQTRWKEVFGSDWPPRNDLLGTPPAEARVEQGAIIASIGPIDWAGVRIERRFEIDQAGRLVITTRTLVDDPDKAVGWALWSVAQVPRPTRVIGRQTDASLDERSLGQAPVAVQRLNDRWIELRPADTTGTKIGFNGDALAGVIGRDVLWIESPARPGDTFPPGERAQFYATALADQNAYVELEFISRRATRESPAVELVIVLEAITLDELERRLADR
jgi:hypothetical protein